MANSRWDLTNVLHHGKRSKVLLFGRLDWWRWGNRRSIQSKRKLCLSRVQGTRSSSNIKRCISQRERKDMYTGPVSRVSWDMRVKLGLWKWMIWQEWAKRNEWRSRWMCGRVERLLLNSTTPWHWMHYRFGLVMGSEKIVTIGVQCVEVLKLME